MDGGPCARHDYRISPSVAFALHRYANDRLGRFARFIFGIDGNWFTGLIYKCIGVRLVGSRLKRTVILLSEIKRDIVGSDLPLYFSVLIQF